MKQRYKALGFVIIGALAVWLAWFVLADGTRMSDQPANPFIETPG